MKRWIPVLFLFAQCTHSSNQKNISMFHGGITHGGIYESNDYKKFGDVKWAFATNGKIFSTPAVVNGMAYTGSEDSNIYAVNATTGAMQWKFKTNGAVSSTPAVYNNMVYAGSYDGNFYALNTETGEPAWKFKTGGEKRNSAIGLWGMLPAGINMEDQYDFFLSSPIVDTANNTAVVYFGSSDGNVYALDAATGKQLWKFTTNGMVHTSPALANGILYVGSWDTYMYALDAKTGALKWKFKTGDQPVVHLMEGIQASPVYADSMIYFGARDGFFHALNAVTGKEIWKWAANGSWIVNTAAVKDGVVYFGTSDTYLFVAADAKTGKEQYHLKVNGYVYSSPSVAGNTAYFGDFTGRMYAFDLSSAGKAYDVWETPARKVYAPGILKKDTLDFMYTAAADTAPLYTNAVKVMNKFYTLGPIVSSPVIANGVIYFGSADGRLYAVALR